MGWSMSFGVLASSKTGLRRIEGDSRGDVTTALEKQKRALQNQDVHQAYLVQTHLKTKQNKAERVSNRFPGKCPHMISKDRVMSYQIGSVSIQTLYAIPS